MFQHRERGRGPFDKEQVITCLCWLAQGMREHSQSVFMVEELQPSWFRSARELGLYGAFAALMFASLVVPIILLGGGTAFK